MIIYTEILKFEAENEQEFLELMKRCQMNLE
jgi:hypothetical protein